MSANLLKLKVFAAVVLSAALFLSAPKTALSNDNGASQPTFDSVATRHQDAVLSQKYFAFKSEIVTTGADGASLNTVSSSGTVNTEGWSSYSTAVSAPDNSTIVGFEYFVKDDLSFKYTSITGARHSDRTDVSEGWGLVPPDIFHRDVPMNPLYFFTQFLENETVLNPGADTSGGCAVLESKLDDGSISFCISGNGIAARFSATGTIAGNNTSMTITIEPLDAPPEIAPPEKVTSLFDEEKKKAEKGVKK